MPQDYRLPDRIPGESSESWLTRAAESIPPASLVTQLLQYLEKKEKRKGRMRASPLWAIVMDATTHGSSVSAAIVGKYLEPK